MFLSQKVLFLILTFSPLNIPNSLQINQLDTEVLGRQNLEAIPSASGIVKFKDNFYAIGDDSPFVFQIDENFHFLSKNLIHSTKKLQENTIPKIDKPDFEAMEMISENEILIFGSGSKSPERDICVLLELGKETTYQKFDLSLFYDHLRQLEIMQGYELNIEALASDGELLYLFNRGRNIIFSLSLQEFLAHCKTGTPFPIPKVTLFSLPKINGLEAGFSGATFFEQKSCLLFTASVEDTPNAYDDGKVLGSFIGVIELKNEKISDDFLFQQIPNSNRALKVESVTIDKVISENQTDLVLVTDNDGTSSEILKLRMTLK